MQKVNSTLIIMITYDLLLPVTKSVQIIIIIISVSFNSLCFLHNPTTVSN